MLCTEIPVQSDAETRSLGQADRTVVENRTRARDPLTQVVPPRDVPRVELHAEEVRDRRRDVRAGDASERRGDIVRRDWDPVEITDGGDVDVLAEAATLVDVGRGDVQNPLAGGRVKLSGRHEVLTRQDGEVKGLRDPLLGRGLLRRHGVFEPREIEPFELLPEADRGFDGEIPVKVHSESTS